MFARRRINKVFGSSLLALFLIKMFSSEEKHPIRNYDTESFSPNHGGTKKKKTQMLQALPTSFFLFVLSGIATSYFERGL